VPSTSDELPHAVHFIFSSSPPESMHET